LEVSMSLFIFLVSMTALYALVFNVETVLTFIRRKARKFV